jgi:hypothetical protein
MGISWGEGDFCIWLEESINKKWILVNNNNIDRENNNKKYYIEGWKVCKIINLMMK